MKHKIKYHIDLGRESRFPRCCVIYFVIRSILCFPFRSWIYRKLFSKIRIKGQRHILCPFHSLYHLLIPLKPYYSCEKCNWIQYADKTCIQCKNCKHKYFMNNNFKLQCVNCNYVKEPDGIELKASGMTHVYGSNEYYVRNKE